MSASCPGFCPDTGLMGKLIKARPRGKRYETTLRVGSLANLALVSARVLTGGQSLPPAPQAPHDGLGGHWTWNRSSSH
jgi:hypothetical protein